METMANKNPHPVKSGIIATVVGGLILSALSAIPQSRGFFLKAMSWVWSGIIGIWSAIVSHYSVPGWALLIIGLFALASFVRLLAVLRPQNEPAYRKYTEDMIDGTKWHWSWDGDKIVNLWCFCPSCDAELIPNKFFDETHFICERCPPVPDLQDQSHGRIIAIMNGNRYQAVRSAEREILRRVRTGERVPFNS